MSSIVHVACQKRRVGSPTVKAVLMYMSDRAADDGSGIWASKATMAADLEMSKRTVQSAIAELISRGLISEAGSRKCDRGFTVDYTINLEAVDRLESTRKEVKSTGAGDSPVQEVHPKGCRRFTSTGAGDSPKPSLEPSLNHPTREEGLFPDLPKPEAPLGGKSPERWFEEFWTAYPKKPGSSRKNASVKFAAALRLAKPEDLIRAAAAYARSRDREDPKFTKHAEFWLSGQFWESWLTEPEIDPERARLQAITAAARAAQRPMLPRQ